MDRTEKKRRWILTERKAAAVTVEAAHVARVEKGTTGSRQASERKGQAHAQERKRNRSTCASGRGVAQRGATRAELGGRGYLAKTNRAARPRSGVAGGVAFENEHSQSSSIGKHRSGTAGDDGRVLVWDEQAEEPSEEGRRRAGEAVEACWRGRGDMLARPWRRVGEAVEACWRGRGYSDVSSNSEGRQPNAGHEHGCRLQYEEMNKNKRGACGGPHEGVGVRAAPTPSDVRREVQHRYVERGAR